jgi:hypothetical protein
MSKCQCLTLKKIQCKNSAKGNTLFCHLHQDCNNVVSIASAPAPSSLSSSSSGSRSSVPAPDFVRAGPETKEAKEAKETKEVKETKVAISTKLAKVAVPPRAPIKKVEKKVEKVTAIMTEGTKGKKAIGKGLWSEKELCDKALELSEEAECYPKWFKPGATMDTLTKFQLKFIASVADPSLSIDDSDQKACDILGRVGPSKEFLEAQGVYNENLTNLEKIALEGYSYQGDGFVNNYLRGNKDEVLDELIHMQNNYKFVFNTILGKSLSEKDLNLEGIEFMNDVYQDYPREERFTMMLDEIKFRNFKREAAKRAFEYVISSLENIILNAPRPERDMMVYRGVMTTDYLKPNEIIPISGFFSTSFDFDVALDYAFNAERRKGEQGVILSILIPKGTPGLVRGYGEYDYEAEYILPPGLGLRLEECRKDVPVAYQKKDKRSGKSSCSYGEIKITFCNASIVMI